MTRLLEKYRKTAAPALQKAFNIGNVMAIPKIKKVYVVKKNEEPEQRQSNKRCCSRCFAIKQKTEFKFDSKICITCQNPVNAYSGFYRIENENESTAHSRNLFLCK